MAALLGMRMVGRVYSRTPLRAAHRRPPWIDTSHHTGGSAVAWWRVRALRVCLVLACLVLGLTTLAESASAGNQPGVSTTAATNASAARGPVVVHEPPVRPHDTDEDPHKALTEPPAAPTGLTAEPGRVEGEVKLSWDAPDPAVDVDHHDYRYRTSGPWSGWITIPGSGSSSNHVGYVSGLSGGVAHTFQVRAIGAGDNPSLPSATGTTTPRGAARVGVQANVAQVAVTLELSPSSIAEGGGVSTVTARLDSVSSTPLTVTVSAEPVTPAVAEDFTLSANPTLTIAAGQLTSTGSVTITANDNTEEGPDKAATVSGTVAGGTNVTGPTDVTLTITDDDEPTATICTEGSAGVNLCRDIDLMSHLAMNDIGGGVGNDIWGWHDSTTGKDYAIMGRSNGTAFVDVSDPLRPIYLGNLRRHSRDSQWRDIKVYRDHAFIVSEARDSGMQVFDLTQLRTVSSPPVIFSETAHYSGFSDAHNIAINEESGFAYAVGTNTCSGGLHMINIQSPANPTSAGCFSGDGYTHDVQCVSYAGPDPDHVGAEICFNSNVDTLTIVDVTNKTAPEMLAREGYPLLWYAHQGWLTEDHAYFLLGDELDEHWDSTVAGTTTYLWDVSDLDSPNFIGTHVSTTRAIDHNQYVAGKYAYQSNYEAGLRILDVTDIANGNLTEVAFFDLVPGSDSADSFRGTWSNYPFFDSGIVIVSERRRGLFVLRPNLVDSIQPKVARATVDGAALTLTYGEALDESSTPATDAFTVMVDGAARSVSDVSVSGSTVALTLALAATRGQGVTVAYTEPETGPIQDDAENKAPALESREVRNNTTGPPDTPDPPTVTVDSATSLTATWTEPSAMPAVTDYDVQYRIGSSGDFTDWPHTGVALTATIANLTEGTAYEVQVQAVNSAGRSSWSSSGSGTPAAPPNNPPTVSATATTPTIVYGRGTVELDGTASDPDSDTLTYAWTSSGGGSFDDSTALDTTWTAPEKAHAPQDIVLTLTATDDGSGHLTDTAEVTVTVLENQKPTAAASPKNSIVDGGDTVALDGTASDPDTPTLSYAWTSNGGGSFGADSALDTTWTAPPKTNEAQDIELTLTVTDDGHEERAARAIVDILVRANEPPAASASASINTVLGGGTVQLDGTASDPQDDNLTYAWSSDGGGFFADDSALDTSWTAPAAGPDGRLVTLTLLVSDTANASADANVRITVRENQPPTVSVAAIPGTVDGGETVALDGTASDPEGDYLAYAWTSNGGGSFGADSALDTTWTAPPKTNEAQDIELTLTVTDDGHEERAARALVDILVRANGAPAASASASINTVLGGGTVQLDGTASDPQDDNLTYAWSSDGGGFFADDSALDTSWTAPAAGPDDRLVTLTLLVSDTANASADANVRITVRENQPPTVSVAATPGTVDGGETVELDGTASDPEGDYLAYAWTSSGGGSFAADSALDTTWTAPPKTNEAQDIELTLTVTDDGHEERAARALVDILVRANGAPAASASASINTVLGGGTVQLDGTASDPQDDNLTYAWSSDGGGFFWNDSALDTSWTAPAAGPDDRPVTLALTVTDTASASDVARLRITVRENQPPTVSVAAIPGTVDGGETVALDGTASDPEGDNLIYTWTSNGGGSFADDSALYTTWTAPPTTDAAQSVVLTLTVRDDGAGARAARASVRITVPGNLPPLGPTFFGGGGGFGGGPTGPTPSDEDFEWTVDRDIEELDSGHELPTGLWSDGVTLWLLDNPDGAGDAVYAYDLATGERVEELEFDLDEMNRAPRGVWSDGETFFWVSDSGQDKLFAYDLEMGERLEEREIALDGRNLAARGIWSDGETVWVLDRGKDSVFAYDLETGALLGEYELADANSDPRGVWSDGVTVWVSNHDPKRLFAYRLPVPPDEPPEEPPALERVIAEEFGELSKAGNNSPRGIWSDGDVMYVADESDDKIYSYNMPDAIDARLASLTLSGVEFGEFSPNHTEYEGVVAENVTETTVEAEAMQRRTSVAIEPPDADGDETNGYQVVLDDLDAITVTVTSADGSREKTYRVSLPEVAWDPARDPWPHCLRGAVSEGFSLVVFEGGSVEELVLCAESRDIVALYALHKGIYISYILGAPDFVNREFNELFPGGLPVMAPLVAGSNGPPSADPFGDDLDAAGPQPWPQCLRGTAVEGFSLAVYEGGSVEELVACAESLDITAVYVLAAGEWVSYILGAPEFANAGFRELLPDGVPVLTPLVAKSEEPPAAN